MNWPFVLACAPPPPPACTHRFYNLQTGIQMPEEYKIFRMWSVWHERLLRWLVLKLSGFHL